MELILDFLYLKTGRNYHQKKGSHKLVPFLFLFLLSFFFKKILHPYLIIFFQNKKVNSFQCYCSCIKGSTTTLDDLPFQRYDYGLAKPTLLLDDIDSLLLNNILEKKMKTESIKLSAANNLSVLLPIILNLTGTTPIPSWFIKAFKECKSPLLTFLQKENGSKHPLYLQCKDNTEKLCKIFGSEVNEANQEVLRRVSILVSSKNNVCFLFSFFEKIISTIK